MQSNRLRLREGRDALSQVSPQIADASLSRFEEVFQAVCKRRSLAPACREQSLDPVFDKSLEKLPGVFVIRPALGLSGCIRLRNSTGMCGRGSRLFEGLGQCEIILPVVSTKWRQEHLLFVVLIRMWLWLHESVHVDNEVTHLSVVDGTLRGGFPGFFGLRVVRIDTNDVEFVEILELNGVEICEFTSKHEVQKLFSSAFGLFLAHDVTSAAIKQISLLRRIAQHGGPMSCTTGAEWASVAIGLANRTK